MSSPLSQMTSSTSCMSRMTSEAGVSVVIGSNSDVSMVTASTIASGKQTYKIRSSRSYTLAYVENTDFDDYSDCDDDDDDADTDTSSRHEHYPNRHNASVLPLASSSVSCARGDSASDNSSFRLEKISRTASNNDKPNPSCSYDNNYKNSVTITGDSHGNFENVTDFHQDQHTTAAVLKFPHLSTTSANNITTTVAAAVSCTVDASGSAASVVPPLDLTLLQRKSSQPVVLRQVCTRKRSDVILENLRQNGIISSRSSSNNAAGPTTASSDAKDSSKTPAQTKIFLPPLFNAGDSKENDLSSSSSSSLRLANSKDGAGGLCPVPINKRDRLTGKTTSRETTPTNNNNTSTVSSGHSVQKSRAVKHRNKTIKTGDKGLKRRKAKVGYQTKRKIQRN